MRCIAYARGASASARARLRAALSTGGVRYGDRSFDLPAAGVPGAEQAASVPEVRVWHRARSRAPHGPSRSPGSGKADSATCRVPRRARTRTSRLSSGVGRARTSSAASALFDTLSGDRFRHAMGPRGGCRCCRQLCPAHRPRPRGMTSASGTARRCGTPSSGCPGGVRHPSGLPISQGATVRVLCGNSIRRSPIGQNGRRLSY